MSPAGCRRVGGHGALGVVTGGDRGRGGRGRADPGAGPDTGGAGGCARTAGLRRGGCTAITSGWSSMCRSMTAGWWRCGYAVWCARPAATARPSAKQVPGERLSAPHPALERTDRRGGAEVSRAPARYPSWPERSPGTPSRGQWRGCRCPSGGAKGGSILDSTAATALAVGIRDTFRCVNRTAPCIHLFLDSPVGLALLLDHRWNWLRQTAVYEAVRTPGVMRRLHR